MQKKSAKKTEQRAITKIRNFIDDIESADGHLEENDKNISWDGTIDFYNDSIDKKENYEFTVDIQVKGRTIYNKKNKNKTTFDLDVVDLKNYLKKDGTLLLVVEFKDKCDDAKVYYIDLLPYNISRCLKDASQTSTNKVRLKLKELKSSNELEEICRNFQINKNIQKQMSIRELLDNNLTLNSEAIAKFSVWDKNASNFDPSNLVGTYQYIYAMDKNDHPIGVDYSKILSVTSNVNVIVSNLSKSIIFNDLKRSVDTTSDVFTFGKAFCINNENKTICFNICGTLNDRLSQLSFIKSISKDKKFLIGNDIIELKKGISNIESLNLLEKRYTELKTVLKKYNINKDIDLDLWNQNDMDEFNIWINALESGNKIRINSKISLMGVKTIQDIRISIIALRDKNSDFKVDSIWNGGKHGRYNFKATNGDVEIESSNLFLNLNEEVYIGDNINFKEMKDVMTNYKFSKDEYTLLNFQVLDIIKAYDNTNNEELLDYALFLTNILLSNDKESENIYYINYCQILKRMNKMSAENIEKLIEFRDKSNDDNIKICCNALIDNTVEKNHMLKKLDTDTTELLKKYPISKYLFNDN